jgi:group II intron reverse transcriptase/maturase
VVSSFEAIPHDRLMQAIETRVCDRHVLKLLRAMLRAGVMQDASVQRSSTGTPQGGVVSPLLANVYLDRLDRAWQSRGHGVLVRYADDLVVMCRTKREAKRALGELRSILAELDLAPKEAKTRIVHLREGGEGIDFLGFEHRWVRGRGPHRHFAFLARWPSRRAMQHARDRLRDLTRRDRLLLEVEQVTQQINRFLRGWAGYFRYGNSARQFDQITAHAFDRLALFVAKRHQRPAGWGRWKLRSPARAGLITLTGTVLAPRPNRPWRPAPNAVR